MDLLINLDSPVGQNKLKSNYITSSPLIPGPSNSVNNDTPNNPFDAVVNAVELNQQPNDLFDIILESAIRNQESNEINRASSDINPNVVVDQETDLSKIKNSIREFLTERISSCSEKKLSSSSSQSNLIENKKLSQTYFPRSFSAGILRPTGLNSTALQDSLCSSCCNKLNNSSPLFGNNETNDYPHKLSGSFLLSKMENDSVGADESFELTKKNLRDEAEKMRKILSFESLPNNAEVSHVISNDSNDSEDLLDVLPPWECREVALSDEEDSIGLPKLKKYRGSLSIMANSINQSAIDENVIHKYLKKRYSRDLGQVEECLKEEKENDDEEKEEKLQEIDTSQISEGFSPDQVAASSSLLEDDSEKIVAQPPSLKLKDLNEDKKIETHLFKEEINIKTLRSKKKAGNEILKKGPMKAVVPLQKMSKNLTSKISSPFKNKLRSSKILKEDKNQTENVLHPVAASTPTKSSPDSDLSIASLRSRENNRTSPTGRKADKRCSSASRVENRKVTTEQSATPSKISSDHLKDLKDGKKVNTLPKKIIRPHSAPAAPDKDSKSKKFGLRGLLLSSPIQKKSIHNPDFKVSSKVKQQPKKLSAKDKENQIKLKEK